MTDAPPPKRQMSFPPITPWITRHDTYKEVQKQLSPYGLGPDDGRVASDKWLPFSVQSKILTRVQIVLEEALFEFLNTNFTHVCEENGWEEMGEAELIDIAVSIMIQLDGDKDRFSSLLDGEIYDHSSETLRCLLLKISQIRHCAVHRTKKIPVITLELMVRGAVYVTSYIQDKKRTEILDSICRPLEPLSFNLEARFGERLAKKAQRNLERINNKVQQLQELLKEEEVRQAVANMEMEIIQRQDEGIYDGGLESLKKAL
ncbi:1ac3cfcb-0e54-4bcf-a194-7083b05f711e [Sclerotinia trifoliorum]|uniref:1ac3cfcb-0e54-4bcf-a194-7083b05f711e n=1 Tax=Sclerotinia trifoliorum TaxID=28548 RepID=A0A8H2W3Q0_9HELO|nr:1ac3cfcb-0e54-4bcf-a194-7083b05f711e [Sclerotinia trifoliorum]